MGFRLISNTSVSENFTWFQYKGTTILLNKYVSLNIINAMLKRLRRIWKPPPFPPPIYLSQCFRKCFRKCRDRTLIRCFPLSDNRAVFLQSLNICISIKSKESCRMECYIFEVFLKRHDRHTGSKFSRCRKHRGLQEANTKCVLLNHIETVKLRYSGHAMRKSKHTIDQNIRRICDDRTRGRLKRALQAKNILARQHHHVEW